MKFARAMTAAVIGSTAMAAGVIAEPLRFESAGVRVGFSATRLNESFYQTEAFSRIAAPGHITLGSNWTIRAAFDVSGGMLARAREADKGFVGTLGPVIILRYKFAPIDLVTGCSGTVLSRENYGGVDFGIPFQFTSHLGLNTHLSRSWSLAYRFQHMSNASLSPHNPGLDLHSFAVSFKF